MKTKSITSHKQTAFTPGDCYWRDATLMVEITPGNYVNEDVARRLGVMPRRDDVENARAGR